MRTVLFLADRLWLWNDFPIESYDILPTFPMFAPVALWQLPDCPSGNEMALKDTDKSVGDWTK